MDMFMLGQGILRAQHYTMNRAMLKAQGRVVGRVAAEARTALPIALS